MKINRHYLLWAALGVTYAALAILIPPDANALLKYNLSETQARLITLTWILPYIGVWFAAFYGYIRCKAYAALIAKSADGQALSLVGDGLMWLAISLPVTAILSSILTYMARRMPSWQAPTTVVSNYVTLLFLIAGFLIIYKGTSSLTKIVKKKPQSGWERLATVAFIVFSISYIYLTLSNPARQFATADSGGRAAYYLPDFLLVTTIIMPYLLVWYWGFRSAYQLHLYQKNVRGVVYKSSLKLFAEGIAAVILSLMSIRVLVSVTTLLSTLTLKLILVLLYALLLMISVGYILIALGAKKLQKIEEV
ncbi:MAG TPA: hypothetical protein VLE74_04070 [Candidatus Saccharimonadales bacterium]|nr:hypothetical protein [Candidatus Saccharimonadales bacterium]